MIRVLIVEDQRMAREVMENHTLWKLPSQMQLWQKLCADRAGVNLS